MANPYSQLFEKQRAHHAEIRDTNADERVAKLFRLREAILSNASELKRALYEDFRKPETETDLTEIYWTVAEINHTAKHLAKWMRPERVRGSAALVGTSSSIHYQPKGVALIIAPWNYPFALLINPLVSAIAAGDCAILKPSELTPSTSRLIKKMISETFDESEIAVVEGDAQATGSLLELPFDHIFFTGSTRVGRIVMQAAAKNLSPVTLELGGKSPVIVDATVDAHSAARNIMWGKMINAGQSCVAPDYVLVHESVHASFVEELKRAIADFYGETEEAREKNPDFPRIINRGHFERIKGLVTGSEAQGAKVEIGGRFAEDERYIAPTLLTRVSVDMPVMQEEIFGPVLPVLAYRDDAELDAILSRHPNPLALYVYSEDSSRADALLAKTKSGGSCLNSCILHLSNSNLPFGGVGESGMGSYHGIHGFRTFSHERSILRQSRLGLIRVFYPPYTQRVKRLTRLLIDHFA